MHKFKLISSLVSWTRAAPSRRRETAKNTCAQSEGLFPPGTRSEHAGVIFWTYMEMFSTCEERLVVCVDRHRRKVILYAHREETKHHRGRKRSKTAVKSKRFINKVTGLCAIGRPQEDFSGIHGIYRCSQKTVMYANTMPYGSGR